jgi:hypothetical protein
MVWSDFPPTTLMRQADDAVAKNVRSTGHSDVDSGEFPFLLKQYYDRYAR